MNALEKYAAKKKLVQELEKTAVWGAIAKGLGVGARMATKAAVRLGHKGPNPYGKFGTSVKKSLWKGTPERPFKGYGKYALKPFKAPPKVSGNSLRGKASDVMFGVARKANAGKAFAVKEKRIQAEITRDRRRRGYFL